MRSVKSSNAFQPFISTLLENVKPERDSNRQRIPDENIGGGLDEGTPILRAFMVKLESLYRYS